MIVCSNCSITWGATTSRRFAADTYCENCDTHAGPTFAWVAPKTPVDRLTVSTDSPNETDQTVRHS